MSITKEAAQEMQDRVNRLRSQAHVTRNEFHRADDTNYEKTQNMRHRTRDLNPSTHVGAKPERNTGAAMAQQQRKQNPEYKIQAAFVAKMAERFPGVMVFSDCAAHIKKTMIQQKRANALSTPGEKWPDVFIAQPSGDYAGLYLEFKVESPYRKDGVVLLSNPHIEAQALTMARLRSKGYKCDFVWTVEMAIMEVEIYLNL